MISLQWSDGSQTQVSPGISLLEAIRTADPSLASRAMGARMEGKWVDLRTPLEKDGTIEVVTSEHPLAGEILRHSAEHVMADAVKQIWPQAQIDVGRTDHSEKFQYDFKIDHAFTPQDLNAIEEKMLQIIRANHPFSREVVSRETARKIFMDLGEHLKVKRLEDIPENETLTLFRQGSFVDLCRGPHLQSTGQIGAVKLLESSASYWKGDESNEALQRIYGIAFSSEAELNQYVKMVEEAKLRDHRKIGKELDLFSISEEVGPGLILWHPKGALVRYLIEEFWRKEHLQHGYQLVFSPHIARLHLWDVSGHTGHYKDNMFASMDVDKEPYQVKPMNCPFHIEIFKSQLRSYRDLPLRYAELGTVYRYERSGVLHGLLRVRGFTQDDAHLYVRPQQLEEEIQQTLDFVFYMYQTFGFHSYEVYLSTRPPKSVGSDEEWGKATQALRQALENKGISYTVDPGEGVFYGPKIDIKVKDALGRAWQCGTIQVDFALPARFQLEYIEQDGSRRTPVMVHRALLGSLERFFGCLLEHYVGAFPFWLSPVQVKVLPITTEQADFAQEVQRRLLEEQFRVEVDDRNEKLGLKIREAQLIKVPFMIILGKDEVAKQVVSVRKRTGEQLSNLSIEAFIELLKKEEKKPR